MPGKNYEDWKTEQEERKESTILIGEPKTWAEISVEENQKAWVWENYIAKGNITLLAALWKAGKSTLLRQLFLAINNEEEFAGQPTIKSKVLIISEETEDEWVEEKEDLADEEIDHILVWSRPIRVKPNLKQWIQLIEEATEYCLEHGVDMIVIDTLTTFWPIDNENDSAQVAKALIPLYNFSENDIAVLLVHHFRKGGGDQAQASRGSGALPAFVDNIIEFTRSEQGSYTQRILKTYGRFNAVIPAVTINLTNEGKYETLGEPWQVSKMARLNKIIAIFEEVKPNCLSVKEVFNYWVKTDPDISVRTIRRYILELFDKNILAVIKEEVVRSKKTPFYALKPDYEKQRTTAYPLPMIPVLSSVESNGTVRSLSAVAQNRAGAEDRTGTSPIREIDAVINVHNGVDWTTATEWETPEDD